MEILSTSSSPFSVSRGRRPFDLMEHLWTIKPSCPFQRRCNDVHPKKDHGTDTGSNQGNQTRRHRSSRNREGFPGSHRKVSEIGDRSRSIQIWFLDERVWLTLIVWKTPRSRGRWNRLRVERWASRYYMRDGCANVSTSPRPPVQILTMIQILTCCLTSNVLLGKRCIKWLHNHYCVSNVAKLLALNLLWLLHLLFLCTTSTEVCTF